MTRKTKNNYHVCNFFSNLNDQTYEEYLKLFKFCLEIKIEQSTGRDASKWICEAIFEDVRKRYFSNKASRIWGIFLSKTKQDANKFIQIYRDYKTSNIFEIEVTEDLQEFEIDLFTCADEKIRNESFSKDSYNNALQLAKKYWKGENVVHSEYIVDHDITIGSLV